MRTVYDVVQTIGSNFIGSQHQGRYLVDTRDEREAAERLADRCNESRYYLPGNSFAVEGRDEEKEFV